MELDEYITINPEIRSGKPCIRGTRMAVCDVLEYLAAGTTIEELVAEFPDLTRNDVLACLAYAAKSLGASGEMRIPPDRI
jgi:uncharacterized protein (DUF433 family)